MTRANGSPTARQAALIAGFGYLAIFVLAIFANFVVLERLVEPDDAAEQHRGVGDALSLGATSCRRRRQRSL